MPLDFPSSPTNGQVYGNYYYNSARGAWNALLPAATPNFFTNATLNTSTLVDATATASATSTTPLIINGLSGQTANLQEWRNATGIAQSLVNSSGNIFVGSTQSNYTTTTQMGIKARAAGQIPLSIQAAASQTANLQEWQNSSGTILSYVDPAGNINFSGSGSFVQSSTGRALFVTNAAATTPLTVKAAASQTADLQQWQSSTGAVLSEINSAGELQVPRIGVGSVMPSTTHLYVTASAAANIPIIAQGAASQTGNLQEWRDSAGNILTRIDNTGRLYLPNQPSFCARGTSGITGQSTLRVIIFNQSIDFNVGSAYNSSTGRFTAPVAGKYMFEFHMFATASFRQYSVFNKNGTTMQEYTQEQPTGGAGQGYASLDGKIVMNLAVNDYVEVLATSSILSNSNIMCSFSGYLIG